VVDDDEAFTKKKVGAAALDESDGRRSASEAGRAPAQRPRRDRGIAAKRLPQEPARTKRSASVMVVVDIWAQRGAARPRAGTP